MTGFGGHYEREVDIVMSTCPWCRATADVRVVWRRDIKRRQSWIPLAEPLDGPHDCRPPAGAA